MLLESVEGADDASLMGSRVYIIYPKVGTSEDVDVRTFEHTNETEVL